MLKIKKITDKTVVKVTAQADPCRWASGPGAYDCFYDCTAKNKPRYYGGTAY